MHYEDLLFKNQCPPRCHQGCHHSFSLRPFGCLRNLEQLLHEELVAAAARFGGGAHAEDVGLHLDGGVAREEVVAEDVAQVPPPQVVDLRDH